MLGYVTFVINEFQQNFNVAQNLTLLSINNRFSDNAFRLSDIWNFIVENDHHVENDYPYMRNLDVHRFDVERDRGRHVNASLSQGDDTRELRGYRVSICTYIYTTRAYTHTHIQMHARTLVNSSIHKYERGWEHGKRTIRN